MPEMYNPDGNYPEGYGYWGYGTAFECIMLAAMESCTGTDNGLSASTVSKRPANGFSSWRV